MYPHYLHHRERELPAVLAEVRRPHHQLVEIIILYPELLHDIEADIHRVERMRNLEKPILVNDENDAYTIRRYIDDAINMAVARMQAYLILPTPFIRRHTTNHAHEWEEKSIFLIFPERWPATSADPLRDAAHNYIVKDVEARLLAVSLPRDEYTAVCIADKERAYNDINNMLNTRIGGDIIHPTFLG